MRFSLAYHAHSTSSSRMILSILFMRFRLGSNAQNRMDMAFQFSLWDSPTVPCCLRACTCNCLSILFMRFNWNTSTIPNHKRHPDFQFSLWDSCYYQPDYHSPSSLTFNSLYEILEEALKQGKLVIVMVSILFMRFSSVVFERDREGRITFQFSLWDSHMKSSTCPA